MFICLFHFKTKMFCYLFANLIDKTEHRWVTDRTRVGMPARDQRLSDKRNCVYTLKVCEFLSFKFLFGRRKRRSAILCGFLVLRANAFYLLFDLLQTRNRKEIALNMLCSPDRPGMKLRLFKFPTEILVFLHSKLR